MTEVASRELRNHTRRLLERVEAGEEVTITVDGRPVAVLRPLKKRRRWMAHAEVADLLRCAQADAGLRADLHELVPDTTADLPSLS